MFCSRVFKLKRTIMEDYRHIIGDSGPLYHEFHPDAFIREPWNAFSSLFFLVPVIFWIWKLRGQYRQHLIISLLLPLLLLNAIGSTLYHAFRAHNFFMLLDWLPAALMNLILSAYMWRKITKRWWSAGVVVLLFYFGGISITFGLLNNLPESMAININYFFIGLCFLIPLGIYMVKTQFYQWHLIVLSVIFLALALLSRSLDYPTPNPFPEFLPQGTHFLWHVISALVVFSLGFYLYFTKKREISTGTTTKGPHE